MLIEDGIKMLKDILLKHTSASNASQFIFTMGDAQEICNFMLNTFFRHFSMYEYSFKPKVELMLVTQKKEEAQKQETGEMSQQDAEDVSQKLGNLDIEGAIPPPGQSVMEDMGMDLSNRSPQPVSERQEVDQNIDWTKVGKLYKPESAIEHIVAKEMSRLKQAFNIGLDTQDRENEEKYKIGGGKKK